MSYYSTLRARYLPVRRHVHLAHETVVVALFLLVGDGRRRAVGHWEAEVAAEVASSRHHVSLGVEAIEGVELAVPAPRAVDAGTVVHAIESFRVRSKHALRNACCVDLVNDRIHTVLSAGRVLVVVRVGEGAGVVMDSHVRVAVVDRAGPLVVGVRAILVHAVEGEIANPAHATRAQSARLCFLYSHDRRDAAYAYPATKTFPPLYAIA